MAAAYMLSQHSSNPLEVHSSDARNRTFVSRYRTSAILHGQLSSDDCHPGYEEPQLADYHQHLAELYGDPSMQASTSKIIKQRSRVPAGFVDLDEDMDSDGVEGGGDGVETQEDVLVDDPEGRVQLDEYGVDDMDDDDGDDEEDDDDEDDLESDESEDDTAEERSILLKPPDERAEIEEEIADLELAVPQLVDDYKIIDRLGTGTFSSVYKAIDLGYHTKWDNRSWERFQPSPSLLYHQNHKKDRSKKMFVAIKRIYVTSGPERIKNEISILEDCRTCRNVSQLITAFREKDQVVAILPYHKNDDFRDFVRILPLEGVRAYFRCMFRALRDIHARGIIHRDVKPANFLFNPITGVGTLCDFGLACRMEKSSTLGACLHTPPSRSFPHGRVRLQDTRMTEDEIRRIQKEARLKNHLPPDRIGYPYKDTRPHSKANRAGTRGFRAPEVLLKCTAQNGAIDVWSAGIILLSFLTKKFPLFQSNDDVEALMEIAAIIGSKRMEKTAGLHSRTFITNVPSITPDGITWTDFVEKLNPDLRTPPKPDTRFWPYNSPSWAQTHSQQTRPPPSSSSPPASRYSSSRSPSPSSETRVMSPEAESYAHTIDDALDFIEQIMQPEATRRMTPRAALAHPFLKDPEDPPDDELVPHPYGQGVCGKLHFFDDVTGEPFAHIYKRKRRRSGDEDEDEDVDVEDDDDDEMEARCLNAGEGIAIGNMPCEFHKEGYGFEFM